MKKHFSFNYQEAKTATDNNFNRENFPSNSSKNKTCRTEQKKARREENDRGKKTICHKQRKN